MTSPTDDSGWIAKTFTRARVMSTRLARIPFGDKSIDLPMVFTRTQLAVAGVGAVIGVLAYGVGSVLGIASWTTWPVVIVTLVAVIGVGFSSVPARGGLFFIEGYLRALWLKLPLTRSTLSSRPPDERRSMGTTVSETTVLRFHPAPSSGAARHSGGQQR
ncbi:MAG: hypothetical protein AB7G47_20035 [Mycolicibacterium sp.]|uniref:hypothetical protein n=1 Tax=Mycolicibacterium sp. TaxID=2320850 RepID=UPI003D0E5D14